MTTAGDIGAYGADENRGMPTPRIDQLANEAFHLTQFLVETGCTPSRAALMTGRYSVHSGTRNRLRDRSCELKAFANPVIDG